MSTKVQEQANQQQDTDGAVVAMQAMASRLRNVSLTSQRSERPEQLIPQAA